MWISRFSGKSATTHGTTLDHDIEDRKENIIYISNIPVC